MIEEYPIKSESREELVNYFCFLHNKVNIRLGKPEFDCKKAFDYWGGDCSCTIDSQELNNSTNSNNNTDTNNSTISGNNTD